MHSIVDGGLVVVVRVGGGGCCRRLRTIGNMFLNHDGLGGGLRTHGTKDSSHFVQGVLSLQIPFDSVPFLPLPHRLHLRLPHAQ